MKYDPLPIVLDNGTSSIKLGYAGEEFPRHSIPNYIGKFEEGMDFSKMEIDERY